MCIRDRLVVGEGEGKGGSSRRSRIKKAEPPRGARLDAEPRMPRRESPVARTESGAAAAAYTAAGEFPVRLGRRGSGRAVCGGHSIERVVPRRAVRSFARPTRRLRGRPFFAPLSPRPYATARLLSNVANWSMAVNSKEKLGSECPSVEAAKITTTFYPPIRLASTPTRRPVYGRVATLCRQNFGTRYRAFVRGTLESISPN